MAATDKKIILITGANGGIGFELAAQLLEDASVHVLLGSRSSTKGAAAVQNLHTRGIKGTVEVVELDVASEESIDQAAKSVESKHGRLNALVNNAAIGQAEGTLTSGMTSVYRTNTIGPMLTGNAFGPILQQSKTTSRIVNIGSSLGSVAMRQDKSDFSHDVILWPYRASKAALNMITVCQQHQFKDTNVLAFVVCPGFTQSNLSGANKAENGAQPTADAVPRILRVLKGERDAEYASFLHAEGTYPW